MPSGKTGTVLHGLWSSVMYLVASLSWTQGSFLSMEQISTPTQFFVGMGNLGRLSCVLQASGDLQEWRGRLGGILSRVSSTRPSLTPWLMLLLLQDLIHFIGPHLMSSGPSYFCGIKLVCGFFVSLQICSLCPPTRIMFFPSLRWEWGFGGGRNAVQNLFCMMAYPYKSFLIEKGFIPGLNTLNEKRMMVLSKDPVSMLPWLWVLLEWEGV